MSDIKRMHYYDHLFLMEKDFTDEQQYHREMRLLHNKTLHRWGVISGLQVEKVEGKKVKVKAGFAIDSSGQEISLDADRNLTIDAPEYKAGDHLYITLSHVEEMSDKVERAGVSGFTRITESAGIQVSANAPPADGAVLQLAHFTLDGAGNVPGVAGVTLTDSTRRSASAFVAPDAITATELAKGAVTMEKLSPEVVSAVAGAQGWVRLPFLPKRYRTGGTEFPEFISWIGRAECDDRGAYGNLEIPVPPRATRIKNLRIAGMKNGGGIDFQLYRIGPSATETGEIMKNTIRKSPKFDETFPIPDDKGALKAETDALALLIHALNIADIWLVAAEFQ